MSRRLLPAFALSLPLRPVRLVSSVRRRVVAPLRRHPRPRTARTLATMVNVRSAPGVLDTDPAGGVLMAPRDGSLRVDFSDLSALQSKVIVLGLWEAEGSDGVYTLPDDPAGGPNSVPTVLKQLLGESYNVLITELINDSEFKAKSGSSTDFLRVPLDPTKRIALYGLGKKDKGVSSVAGAAKFAVQKGIQIKSCTSVGLFVEDISVDAVVAATEGAQVGAYVDERYREKKDSEKVPEELILVGLKRTTEYENAVARGTAIATGIITTKEVVAAPANALTPATLAVAAETVASETGLEIKIMGRAECEELGMGSYLGVGRGSTDEPKFIHMTYKPEGEVSKKLCVVGKAVTFDTGGTNLKTGGSMIELMKFDMGGSAVALGTAKAIGHLKPKGVEVHFIMPAVENMIGDRAIHPGDILKASNGKTIEVINTDAEGRLCLADALVYAENLGDVDYIVDLATLTGAIIVSLGNDVAGMWSSSDELSDALIESSKSVGESLWRMPLVDEYAEGLKSKIADLRNIGVGRAAGSIVAALFLREFVTTKNWAHLDIAGTVWSDKKGGATGYGVKTMTHWIESHANKA